MGEVPPASALQLVPYQGPGRDKARTLVHSSVSPPGYPASRSPYTGSELLLSLILRSYTPSPDSNASFHCSGHSDSSNGHRLERSSSRGPPEPLERLGAQHARRRRRLAPSERAAVVRLHLARSRWRRGRFPFPRPLQDRILLRESVHPRRGRCLRPSPRLRAARLRPRRGAPARTQL